jgi:GNAT superfamily N-acetyltransferase
LTREERVVLQAYRSLAPESAEVGGGVAMRFPAAPDSPMLNRVVGLGVRRTASEEDVDAALAWMGSSTSFYVAVSGSARPSELDSWLAARGLERAWGWMAFTRGVEGGPEPETGLRLLEVTTRADAEAFARIVRIGYDLPSSVEPDAARAPDVGWLCWLALDGDTPASAAALFVSEAVGYLGFAATLPTHRGKGAQTALLAARIRRAAELGCERVLTETGERRDDRPSNSYRNILRAGFQEAGVTANWLRRR